jgi:hypothetical protein
MNTIAIRPIGSTEMRRPLFFFHMPKTGGRTVEQHLLKTAGAAALYHPKRNRRFYTALLTTKVADPISPRGRHVVGHFASISLIEGEERGHLKICFWRHPSDWMLSLYNYRLHRNAHRIYRKFTFLDFRRSMLRNPMTEHFLLHCGDVPGLKYFFMSDARKFTRALRLARKFDRFDDIQSVSSVLRLLDARGTAITDYNRIQETDKHVGALDAGMRAHIKCTNRVDYLLHRLALTGDVEAVVTEARIVLNRRFEARDVLRLAALPYYRFKTWVLPFVPPLREWKPAVGCLEEVSSDTR